jgi:hypothetical protein
MWVRQEEGRSRLAEEASKGVGLPGWENGSEAQDRRGLGEFALTGRRHLGRIERGEFESEESVRRYGGFNRERRKWCG